MILGASTKSFGGLTVAETAAIFEKSGLDCAELCFCQTDLGTWKYNLSGMQPLPESLSVKRAINTFSEHGINVCALGLYNCLWMGETEKRIQSLEYFTAYCDLAAECGVGIITTHTGTPGLWLGGTRTPCNLPQIAAECFLHALFEAHKRGITIAVEFGENDALCTYSDFLHLKTQTESAFGTSEMLKYIGVPVCDDPEEDYTETALFHLKDKKHGSKFYECAGLGDGNFTRFFGRAAQFGDRPVVLEYVNSSNLASVADFVRRRGEV